MVLLNVCERVMQKMANDMNISDIYDERIIKKLNPKVFPLFMLKTEKKRRAGKTVSDK